MSITVMKQALEALEPYARQVVDQGKDYEMVKCDPKVDAAITALRTAIEQAEKEPAQRQWVGLTEAEINEWDYDVRDVVMDIEKLLKEKNHE